MRWLHPGRAVRWLHPGAQWNRGLGGGAAVAVGVTCVRHGIHDPLGVPLDDAPELAVVELPRLVTVISAEQLRPVLA